MQAFQVRAGRINDAPPLGQWIISNLVPLITRIQGASYLRELQFGVTDVRMNFAVPVTSGSATS